MNMNKLEQCVEDCKFTLDSLKLVFDRLYAIKGMKQSERVNFKAVEQQLRTFIQSRMKPIRTYFKQGKFSEEQRFDLGCAIANVYEFFEGQLAQLIGATTQTANQED